MKAKEAAVFILVSLLISLGVFREAMWGARLLAPLDILPNAFVHYKFMDSGASGIPDNHHIIDQILYDLPLQHLIYENVRKGIIPWWDPYTYGGRPLLADAHINGTDPVRLLCYFAMPFELAYNWSLILKSILTGLGMFFLLRYFGFSIGASTVFALTYQFAGCFAVFFGHPWIQGSFLYYPYLWWAWDRGIAGRFGTHAVAGAVLCALVFYSGNLQSHIYLPLFASAFLAGAAIARAGHLGRRLFLVGVSGLLGAFLAAPVLLNQVEFYLLSTRAVADNAWGAIDVLKGPLSLAGVFPWALGSFRTIDLSKVVGSGSLGFTLFTGTAASILALVAIWQMFRNSAHVTSAAWTSLLLVVGYFGVISTPLEHILYTRSSALAVMGLILLAAAGFRSVLNSFTPALRKLGFFTIGITAVGVVCLQAALSFYPRFEPEIRKVFLSRVEAHAHSIASEKLRAFQVSNFPHEVGPVNPEVALAVLSCLTLGIALLQTGAARRSRLLFFSTGLGLCSVLFFYARFVPSHPVELWTRMLAGGPAQARVIEAAEGSYSRVFEIADMQEMIFPNAIGALYRVHAVHGYSALQPTSIFRYPPGAPPVPKSWIADIFVDENRTVKSGRTGTGLARFRWASGEGRHVSIIHEDLNSVTVSISPGPAGDLIRTDTFYPGWTLVSGSGRTEPEQKMGPCFSTTAVETSTTQLDIVFRYRPRYLNASLLLVAAAFLGLGGLVLWAPQKMRGFADEAKEASPTR